MRSIFGENGINSKIPLMKTQQEIILWLREQIAAETKIDAAAVRTNVPFTDFGLDSIVIVTLVTKLEEWLNTSLDPTIFWEFPSIKALSDWLVNEHLRFQTA
jgi:acyl carrier protein